MTPEQFVARWKDSQGAELANSQSFLKELCQFLDVPQPDPTHADEDLNRYTFEKAVTRNNKVPHGPAIRGYRCLELQCQNNDICLRVRGWSHTEVRPTTSPEAVPERKPLVICQ